MTRNDLTNGLRMTLGHPPFPPMVEFIVEFVADWLDQYTTPALWTTDDLLKQWREEMGE